MSDHIRLWAQMRIKDGQASSFREACQTLTRLTKQNDSGVLSYSVFIDQDTGEGFFLEEYEDSDALIAHFSTSAEIIERDLSPAVEVLACKIFGSPGDAVRQRLSEFDIPVAYYEQVADIKD